MKRLISAILSIFLCIAFLAGCGKPSAMPTPEVTVPTETAAPEATPSIPDPSEESAPTHPEPVETEPTKPAESTTAAVPTPEENTYRLSLPGFISIFDQPTYDGCYVGPIGEDGVFTIVEEKVDSENFVWGKLKSGAGWINLSELETNPPVMAGLGSEHMLKNPHYLVNVDDAEYMEYLVFAPTQTITDVRFTMLLPEENGYAEDTLYETIPELEPGKPLIAQVVFYGDFTTYGLSFRDATGTQRHFAVSISGRNGAPVLQEYTA